MAIIYETINLHNLEHGINPWRYIGSDQYDNPLYLGSNRALKRDIAALGADKFVKRVIEDCGNIDNKLLRKIESEKHLKLNKVRADESYYNQTDRDGPGRTKGCKHSDETKKVMAAKKEGTIASPVTKKKMSDSHSGEKNPNALTWTVTTPTGETIEVKGLAKWAKDNGYNHNDVYHNRKGWTSVKSGTGKGGPKIGKQNGMSVEQRAVAAKNMTDQFAKRYEVVTPDGEIHDVTNLNRWCRENNVSQSTVYNNRRGWKCNKIT